MHNFLKLPSIFKKMKQVILVRHDLKLPKGKLAAQVSHASTETALNSRPEILSAWRGEGMKKVVLRVSGIEELIHFKKECQRLSLVHALITDAGKTVLEPGTVTCLGIGPDADEKIDRLTGSLKMV